MLLIGSAVFFTFLIYRDKTRIPLLIQSIINQKYALSYNKNKEFWINAVNSINSGILIAIIVSFWFPIQAMTFELFINTLIILLFFFTLKVASLYLLGGIFELLSYAKKYYQLTFSNLFLISLIFYPIIVFFSYFKSGGLLINYSIYLFYLFFIIYTLSKILIMKRLNLLQFKFIFYNILYLCTFEVLPYVGLLKLLDSLY